MCVGHSNIRAGCGVRNGRLPVDFAIVLLLCRSRRQPGHRERGDRVVITLLLWLYLMGTVLILGGFLNVMLYHYFRPLPIVLKEESRYGDPLFEERIGVDRQRTVAETASDPQKTAHPSEQTKLTYD